MIYIVALLWVCSITVAVLVVLLVHEYTRPIDPDLESLRRHAASRVAFSQARTSTSTTRFEATGNASRRVVEDPSRATSCLASEGRPATAPISSLRAKVDRPIPAVVALPVATAGKFDQAAHDAKPSGSHAGLVAPSR